MPRPHHRTISKRAVHALPADGSDALYWDRDLPGFGVRVYPSGRKSYVVQCRGPNGSQRVTVNGEVVERRAFLDGALHVERWRGLAFGVFTNRLTGFHTPDLNFHGLTIAVRLPTVGSIEGGTWSVRADIDACPELELVLPARKEAVEAPFLNEMRDAARLAIYRAMAAADPSPRVARSDHGKAVAAGIAMPEPPAELRPWRPCTADVDDWRDVPAFAPVYADSLVMAVDPEPQDAQTLWRAAERAGMAGRLFESDTRFEGYAWYGGLARAASLRIDVTGAGTTHPLDALRAASDVSPSDTATAPGLPDALARRDAIHMHLNIVRGEGPPGSMTIPADLAFVGEGWSWIADAQPLVTRDSDLDPVGLKQLLRAAFFSASDDADAILIALTLLASEEEAKKHTIAEAVWREILWVVPRDREVSITVSHPRPRPREVRRHGAAPRWRSRHREDRRQLGAGARREPGHLPPGLERPR